MDTLFNKSHYNTTSKNKPVTVLGRTFANDEDRRIYFRDELRKKLPELKLIEGFPIGEDDDILNLSDPPFYTACPNPWINDFIDEWQVEKAELEAKGKRIPNFVVDEPYASDVSEGKNNPIYNAHSYHTKVPHPAIMRYILHYTQPGDIVFDGFAGTGMTGVAAGMCGNPDNEIKLTIEKEFKNAGLDNPNWGARHAVCGDLSPVASFISYNLNKIVDIKRFEQNIWNIYEILCKEFGHYYKIANKNIQGSINYIVWSEIVGCKTCGKELNFHDLTSDYENMRFTDTMVCISCGTRQKRIESQKINETVFDSRLNRTITRLKYVPSLINLSANSKRIVLRNIDKSNLSTEYPLNGFVPINNITEGDKFSDPKRVGCTSIHQFYPERTLSVLSFLYSLIYQEKDLAIRNSLLLVFTSMLPKLNRMNRYMPQHGSRALVGPMANTLYIPPIYVENNPLDQFKYQANKIIKALDLCKKNNLNQICSATMMLALDNSIDYIFTDPPFGANIMYSELNIISESWLKIWTRNEEEAISNKTQRKGVFEYQNIITRCFLEYFRILKPGKWMTVEFSNTSAAVWNTLQNSIQRSGFVIASVTDLNKERGGLHSMLGPTAVKQDLAISCYKPSSEFDTKFQQNQNSDIGIWDFIYEHLCHLPVHLIKENATTAIIERSAKILFDRLIAFYVQRNLPVPIDAVLFQKDLRDRFIERDGMFFTTEQVHEYESKKAELPNFIQLSLLVASEQDGVMWLRRELEFTPQTYQELQPKWMQALAGVRKGDILPELRDILEENFLQNESGAWYLPDLENEIDLEKVRTGRMLRLFATYREQASKPKGKIKEARVEALRVGFKQCYKDKDFKTIVKVGDSIPNNLLMEDEVLLQYYDIAISRV